MPHPIKPFLSLSILMLVSHPIAHAESNGQPLASNRLQDQVRELQTQMMNIQGKIAVLETANQDISAMQNDKKPESHSDGTNVYGWRTANGRGR